ncbi:AlpA family transcriptional regulator [Aliidiomarina iranensis]|uniref:AlpA family transcriptional regulator n=1 Tax=Aliidiomarina iranensis TaxID=1434071 RepID=A0A432W0A8_9GAMM|nr:helix-turn-helix domain-containing protein [Aliidiomarina iranensis]RUO22423.1 AlpA family transcriptional regulator [Aliidiomarina iranensis]
MQYLSDKSVAARYDIARSTVWLWLQKGKLPKPVKINGTRTRWPLADLEAFEQRQGGAA